MASNSYSVPPVAQPVRRDLLDRRAAHIDQRDVRPVVGLDSNPYRRRSAWCRSGWSFGASSSAVAGSFTISRILLADELGGGVVGRLVDDEVVERRHERGAAGRPALPRRLAPPLVLGDLDGGLVVRCRSQDAAARSAAPCRRRSAYSDFHEPARIPRSSARCATGCCSSACAGTPRQFAGLLRDHRDRLDRRRAGADHADPLAGEDRRPHAASGRCGRSCP